MDGVLYALVKLWAFRNQKEVSSRRLSHTVLVPQPSVSLPQLCPLPSPTHPLQLLPPLNVAKHPTLTVRLASCTFVRHVLIT